MDVQQSLPFPAAAPSGLTVINPRCSLRAHGEHRVVVVAGLAVHHYSAQDAVAHAYAMVFLVDGGYATQRETETRFPGSSLTMRFATHAPRQAGLAFPGPRAPHAPTPAQPLPA